MVFITDFNEGDMISNVYLCKNKQTGTTKSGKTYYNLELVDKTGSIAGKVWELSNAIGHFESKNFIKVDGQVTSFNNELQLNIKKIRIADEGEYSEADYMPCTKKDIEQMYKALMEDGYDAVGTRRVTRKGEPAIRSFFARKFYRLMSKISKANMVDGARDYRLMNRKYVDALLSLKEYNRFSKGLFGWVGFKVKWLEFENVNRVAGETKWSFWQLFLYSLDGIVAFSNAPLYMASIAGVFSFIVAIIAMLFIIIRRLVFGDPVAGWASTVVIILFIGGIQLLSIGILGLYLSKLYLEAKDRPIYLIGESNIEKPTEKN